MQIKENYQLSDLTTFHIGGKADFFVMIDNEEDLQQALEFARTKHLSVFVLGGGSNILISDEGFRGLVIHNKIRGLRINDNGLVEIGSGEIWDSVVEQVVKKNLAGLECLSGIPGTAGGGVVQNIGAYGQTLGDAVIKIFAVEIETGKEKEFGTKQCEFEYRSSWFKRNPGKFVVTGFRIQLTPGGKPNLSYPDVQKQFGSSSPTLDEIRKFIIEVRASKGYVIMSGYECYQTAGSFFKNPVVTKDKFENLQPVLGDVNTNRFWEVKSGYKLSAAFLMEEAGFGKGYREGSVGISPKHSLSVVNFGNATANEVKTFARKIKDVVLQKFGVQLEEEVLYV